MSKPREGKARKRANTDPFEIVGQIPKGKSYQWVALAVFGDKEVAAHQLGKMEDAGWKPVPARRHPSMRKVGNRIMVRDQVLMERATRDVLAARAEEIATAKEFHSEHPAHVGSVRKTGGSFPTRTASDPSKIDAADWYSRLEENRKRAADLGSVIPVTIGIELSERHIEASAIVNLPLEEYARRMVLMGRDWGNDALILIEVRQGVFRLAEFKVKQEA